MRLVEYLLYDGQFDEARKEWDVIRNNERGITTHKAMRKEVFEKTLRDASRLGTDLVRMNEHEYTCEECSKYQGRVFSISGRDKRFPKLPEQFYMHYGIHEGCRHFLNVFFERHTPLFSGVELKDIIKHSNRPYVDDRTQEQITKYEEWKNEKRFVYDEQWFIETMHKTIERKLYEAIRECMPEMAPKSFSGYMRMKNAKTKNWLKFAEAAKEKGFNIDE